MQVHSHKAKKQQKRDKHNTENKKDCEMCKRSYVSLVWEKIKTNKKDICKATFQAVILPETA